MLQSIDIDPMEKGLFHGMVATTCVLVHFKLCHMKPSCMQMIHGGHRGPVWTRPVGDGVRRSGGHCFGRTVDEAFRSVLRGLHGILLKCVLLSREWKVTFKLVGAFRFRN